jgi:hypothetical protein
MVAGVVMFYLWSFPWLNSLYAQDRWISPTTINLGWVIWGMYFPILEESHNVDLLSHIIFMIQFPRSIISFNIFIAMISQQPVSTSCP